MKSLIALSLLLLPALLSAQAVDSTARLVCMERGHVNLGDGTATGYCGPYVLDQSDTTFIIYPACVTGSFFCSRCHEQRLEETDEIRKVIWVRNE